MCRGTVNAHRQTCASRAGFAALARSCLFVWCSLSEPGLWDYVITNETMEGTGKQLADIAGRALAGQIGNGIAELQDPDMSQTLSNQTVCLSTHDPHSFPAVAHSLNYLHRLLSCMLLGTALGTCLTSLNLRRLPYLPASVAIMRARGVHNSAQGLCTAMMLFVLPGAVFRSLSTGRSVCRLRCVLRQKPALDRLMTIALALQKVPSLKAMIVWYN